MERKRGSRKRRGKGRMREGVLNKHMLYSLIRPLQVHFRFDAELPDHLFLLWVESFQIGIGERNFVLLEVGESEL